MNPAILGVFALMGLTMWVMVRGQRRNRDFASALARVLEEGFQPRTTSYRNIGGVVGYHFTYELNEPYRQVEGTMTFFPRHTLFYYPIARLLKREDELRLSISADFFAVGEAHVVRAARYAGGWLQISDEEEMDRREVEIHGERFVALYFYRNLADRMIEFLDGLPETESLRHFACFGKERLFYLQVEPKLESLPETLTAVLQGLPRVAE